MLRGPNREQAGEKSRRDLISSRNHSYRAGIKMGIMSHYVTFSRKLEKNEGKAMSGETDMAFFIVRNIDRSADPSRSVRGAVDWQ